MFHWSLDPVGGNLPVVLALVLGLLGLLALGPPRGKTNPRRRAVLGVLRAAVVAMVLTAMLRPTLVYTEMKRQAATLVVLCDKSRSMTVPDGIGGKTRYDSLREALDEARPALRALGRDFELKAYAFDGRIEPVEVADGRLALPETPDGDQTAIGASLQDVLAREAGKRFLGVVLLSDGAQQARPPRDEPAQTAAARYQALGVKLYTFPLGQSRGPGQAQDVRLTDLRSNPTVFEKTELSVSADLHVDGFVHRTIPVTLLFETSPGEMEEVARRDVEVKALAERVPIDLAYVPEKAGDYKLTLRAEPQPGELVTTNNELSTFVRVLKGGLNVLYLEGDFRVESKFLLRALEASPNIRVDFFRIRRDPAVPLEQGPRTAFVRPPGLDLAEAFKPGKYDVYVLGDLDSAAFSPEELKQLADVVSKRAGLIMLGGFHSFGPGGYGQTPLAAAVPVRMDRFDRQRFDEKVRDDVHLPGPVRMRPTAVGQVRSPMSLGAGPEANNAAWAALPPLEGINRLGSPAPGALVLAADDAGHPILVSHHFGAGRVMAFAADSTWRWWMRGFEAQHKRFWRQVVLWLAQADEADESDLWVKLQPRRYAPGQRVEFAVGANDPAGEPIREAHFRAEAVLPDGRSEEVQLVAGEAGLTGTFRGAETPGDYTIRVFATLPGPSEAQTTARFVVFQQDLELDNAAADVGAMEGLAAVTGGESLAPEQLPELLDRLLQESAVLEVEQVRKLTFWDTWPFFLVFVATLGVEWYLRKRWGLV